MQLTDFHPAVARWFGARLGAPSPPQVQGWPPIARGEHTLIAAPTGSGKTLAAFLIALDGLLCRGVDLPDATQVLYVSPLKALGNDVERNLRRPLAEIRELDPSLPDVRVAVRSGDTPQSARAKQLRKPPHVLVTTPESLYILLTSDGGRRMLGTIGTVIVDEIHATLGSKRGSLLALCLERLSALVKCTGGRELQRIGLSATQKPLVDVGRFLVGVGRECTLVDVGHLREIDVALEVPPSPLEAVCSHEVWDEIYARMAELISQHRTTLVFVNTRKLAERIAARLTEALGEEEVASHHGSLSKDRRLDAEQRLKSGRLRALVATASLELGIDVGEVDLVIQVGATWSIATFLQRVGRAGHALGRVPKGRLFPLTADELVAGAALLRCVARGDLDRTPIPAAPRDILAQHVVASCVPEPWDEAELLEMSRRAWPYRDLDAENFDSVVALHTGGRYALLHRDGVGKRLRATRRARIPAVTSGGAIPDTGDYRVLLEPAGTRIGSVNEDFAIESSRGDIFQLGNASWRILRVEPGIVRVADAQGAPPTLPFWLGEAPSRTPELSAAISELRAEQDGEEWFVRELGLPRAAAAQIAEYLDAGERALGCIPTQQRLVLERFFDESGGMQLVLHAPFGGRINRALGLALRKKFCVGFGFELQAAANEEAIVISLGPQHAFELADVFDYLHPNTARHVLVQALLPAPMFQTRWRWNVTRALLLPRMDKGRRVPTQLQRMRAEDLLVKAFPDVVACPETLPGGPIEVPEDHPLVGQTVEDCLTEAMDFEGFLGVLHRLRDGSIERVAIDTPEPSPLARGILSSQVYTFLDDAPLEERRARAVVTRRALDVRDADELGALDAAAVARVREEAWPEPRDAEEVHEALLWMGYVRDDEAGEWLLWLDELRAAGRVVREEQRWFAVEASRDPVEVLRGRMEALGPVVSDDPAMLQLEGRGHVLRVRVDGSAAWCDRRLLARIQRYTLDRLRREIRPVSAADLLRFLACWQHVDEEYRLEGPRGVAQVVAQLAGYEVPAAAWEAHVLPARVRGYRRDWLDQVTLGGEVVWGRLWGASTSSIRTTPVALLPREELDGWLGLAGEAAVGEISSAARDVHAALLDRGAMFQQELERCAGLLPSQLEHALGELIAQGLVTADSFAALRQLVVPPSRRRRRVASVGRWSAFRGRPAAPHDALQVARQLLKRTGVVFRRTLTRERIPLTWRELLRPLRTLELRGEIRGGRFVAGFDGEQFALPGAVELMRKVRRDGERAPVEVAAADPLNLRGILTPDERVSPTVRRRVLVG